MGYLSLFQSVTLIQLTLFLFHHIFQIDASKYVDAYVPETGSLIELYEIFGETITFRTNCEENYKHTMGFQNAGSMSNEEKYFNFERIYYGRGNDINVKFHFADTEKRLVLQVWEKYLMQYSLKASENFFIEIKVFYNGEEYTNGKVIRKIPGLIYEENNPVEMYDIDYNFDNDTCFEPYLPINIDFNFSGLIYNEIGNRAIRLDDVKFFMQVLAFDTTRIMPMKGTGTVYKAEPKTSNYLDTFNLISTKIDGAQLGENYGLPSISWKSKPFICYDKHFMIFRLSESKFEEALSLEGSRFFNPRDYEKPMKDWIQIPYRYRNKWKEFVEDAATYIKE
jgi:hypothetical protein